MKRTVIIILLLLISTGCFALDKVGIGSLGIKALFGNIEVGLGCNYASMGTTDQTTILGIISLLNNIAPNTFLKTGVAYYSISGKLAGNNATGSTTALLVGVEQYITEKFSVEFDSYVIQASSNTVAGTTTNGNAYFTNYVHATYYL
jgi:hypothetical protein